MKHRSFINEAKTTKIQNLICILIGISIFCFIVIKSTIASLTHDESITYLHFVPQKFMDIISYKIAYTNNHILNTVLIKGSEYLFGNSEIAIRLPNNLSYLVYMIYTFLLLRKMNPRIIIFPFTLMILNPYLIDFFGLARGYGLSIGFLMMSLYHLIRYFKTNLKRDLIFFNFGAFLAIFSSFILVCYYISALIIFNLIIPLQKVSYSRVSFRWFFKQNKINGISVLIISLATFEPFRRTFKWLSLDFGGKKGFIPDTLHSLVVQSYFGISTFWESVLVGFVCSVILILFLYIFYKAITDKLTVLSEIKPVVVVNLLTILIIVFINLAHYIIGVDFPIQRFALFLYPLIILNITLLYCMKIQKMKYIIVGLIIGLTILTGVNFSLKLNMSYYRDWAYDCDTKTAMRTLVNDYKQKPDGKVTVSLGVSWYFEPTANYYRERWHLYWLDTINREAPDLNDNYIYVFKSEYQPSYLAEEQVIFTSYFADALLVRRSTCFFK
ncbi:MAG: hypothetical protein AMS27_05765 [Bacteroides sp. SM23_62_1]|nr:MAG: hypothetical protein AMS27_05765 [Bacteroides sp. SM23_62_1]